jgi:Holliday junction resolvase RusA-like endonuclease
VIYLTLPVPPSANRYWRRAGTHLHLSADAVAYRRDVANRCRLAKVKPLIGDVSLAVVWYRARKSGDTGNRLKQLEDALQGHAYLNDNQIAELHIVRRDTDRSHPRVEVRIAPYVDSGTLKEAA